MEQPQAIKIESSLLGMMLINNTIIDETQSLININSFYKSEHQVVYSAILEVYKTRDVDILTVVEQLQKANKLNDVGGAHFIATLTTDVNTHKAHEYALIVKEKHMKREFIRVSQDLEQLAFNDSDLLDLVNKAEKELYEITDLSITSEAVSVKSTLEDTIKQIERIQTNKNELLGIGSGITKLDRITSGFIDSDLIILAARPSMGKTSLALFFARMACRLGKNVLFFSLEMSKEQLTKRILSGESDIDTEKIIRGEFEWDKVEPAIRSIEDMSLFIDDKAMLGIHEFRSKCRKYKKKHNIDIIFVDYLQLMVGEGRDDFSKASSISPILKATAKDLNVPIVALSQLSRKVEDRTDKTPKLSDLRMTGQIEQDADVVIFPVPLRKIMPDEDPEYNDNYNKVIIKVAKHRQGRTGDVETTLSNDMSNYDVDVLPYDSNRDIQPDEEPF